MKKTIKENKGFTLVELLIVVAIIAVLAAIAIPIMNQRLEGSRESADVSTIRSAYALAVTKVLTDPTSSFKMDYNGVKGTLESSVDGSNGGLQGTATKGGTSTVIAGGYTYQEGTKYAGSVVNFDYNPDAEGGPTLTLSVAGSSAVISLDQ